MLMDKQKQYRHREPTLDGLMLEVWKEIQLGVLATAKEELEATKSGRRERKAQSTRMKEKLKTGRKQIWLLQVSIWKRVQKVLGREAK